MITENTIHLWILSWINPSPVFSVTCLQSVISNLLRQIVLLHGFQFWGSFLSPFWTKYFRKEKRKKIALYFPVYVYGGMGCWFAHLQFRGWSTCFFLTCPLGMLYPFYETLIIYFLNLSLLNFQARWRGKGVKRGNI